MLLLVHHKNHKRHLQTKIIFLNLYDFFFLFAIWWQLDSSNEKSAFRRMRRKHYSEKCGRRRGDFPVSSNSSWRHNRKNFLAAWMTKEDRNRQSSITEDQWLRQIARITAPNMDAEEIVTEFLVDGRRNKKRASWRVCLEKFKSN